MTPPIIRQIFRWLSRLEKELNRRRQTLKPLKTLGFSVCLYYTVRAQLRLPLACQRRTAQADSGLAGAFGFFHYGEYLRPSGLQFETFLGAGDGERHAPSRSGRFRQQMGAKRRNKRGVKPESVLSKMLERTAQNRVIFEANAKKEKSRNPHGYWIFRWRKRWDSNPRAREGYLIRAREGYLISSLFNHYDFCGFFVSLSGCFVRPKP